MWPPSLSRLSEELKEAIETKLEENRNRIPGKVGSTGFPQGGEEENNLRIDHSVLDYPLESGCRFLRIINKLITI